MKFFARTLALFDFRSHLIAKLAMALCLSSLISSCRFYSVSFGGYSNLKDAEEFSRQKRYEEAVSSYRAHITARLADQNRPDWENPWFYLILIGDIQIGQEKIESALESYEQAEQKGVDERLVSDRYRSAGRWYEKRGQFRKAYDTLKKYRDRDPLLFDAQLDRIGRELSRLEDEGRPTWIPDSVLHDSKTPDSAQTQAK